MANELIISLITGICFGSFPTAIIIARIFKLADPRSYGSKNPGATNVMRSGNKLAGRLVFVIDCLKGIIPALALGYFFTTEGIEAITAFFAVVGHAWNPFLKFKGGKGVATGFGALLAIDWRLCALAGAVFLVIYFATKTVSLASVSAFICTMFVATWLYEFGSYSAVAVAGIAMIITIRHRQNFKLLLEGKEKGFKKH